MFQRVSMPAGHHQHVPTAAEHVGGLVFRVMLLVAMFGLAVGGLQLWTRSDTDDAPAVVAIPATVAANADVAPIPVTTAEIPRPAAVEAPPTSSAGSTPPPAAPFGSRVGDAPLAVADLAAPAAAAAFFPIATQPARENARPLGRAPTRDLVPPAAAFAAMPAPAAPVAPPPTVPVIAKPAAVAALPAPNAPPSSAPSSSDLVDLNSASLEQLNALRGGGMIGRAIVRGRPYASAEDLLRKRVLNRSTFDRVRDQMIVR